MKLSIFDRVLLFLSMLAMLAGGVFLLLLGISVLSINNVAFYFRDVITTAGGIIAVIAIAAVMILVAVKLVISLFSGSGGGAISEKASEKIVLKTGDSGSIMVSSDLVKDLASRFAKTSEDVKDVECKVICEESGVKLLVKFFLKRDIELNQFLEKMQVDMKEYVEVHCGVEVKNIDMCADVGQTSASKLR